MPITNIAPLIHKKYLKPKTSQRDACLEKIYTIAYIKFIATNDKYLFSLATNDKYLLEISF